MPKPNATFGVYVVSLPPQATRSKPGERSKVTDLRSSSSARPNATHSIGGTDLLIFPGTQDDDGDDAGEDDDDGGMDEAGAEGEAADVADDDSEDGDEAGVEAGVEAGAGSGRKRGLAAMAASAATKKRKPSTAVPAVPVRQDLNGCE